MRIQCLLEPFSYSLAQYYNVKKKNLDHNEQTPFLSNKHYVAVSALIAIARQLRS